MIPVAVVTGGSDQQTLLEQTVSVDTLAVVLQDIVFTDIVDPCHRRPFPVALPAKAGYIQFVSAGGAVRGRQNIMFAVTLLAGRSIQRLQPERLPVYSLVISYLFLFVTAPAVHRF